MSEESDPVELNLLQQYRHTVKLNHTTSRMKNKDWYRDALDLDLQLHCYLNDETDVQCYLYIKSKQHYEEVGRLNLQQLSKYEDQETFIQEILARDSVVAAKPQSLGVIFYLADEISFAGLGPEHQDPDELLNLSAQLLDDPKEILEDKTVSTETHAWRLFPFSGVSATGGEFATAVAVPRKLDPFLALLRKIGDSTNFPIRTCALSAPLCAVASLPWCASVSEQGAVAIFHYSRFTLLAFFNSSGDLIMMRHVAHAQGASVPRNLGPIVFSAATSYELENPEIYILPMTGGNVEVVILSLQTAMKDSALMLVDSTEILQSRGVAEAIPLEMMTTTHDLDPAIYPLAGNATFVDFKQEGWPLQDFLPPSEEELSHIPGASAMLLLKISRMVKMVVALVVVGLIAYAGMEMSTQTSSLAMHSSSSVDAAVLKDLQGKLHRYNLWDSMLKDRSKGWVTMELINQVTPSDGSVVLGSVRYQAKLVPSAKSRTKQGVMRTWIVAGQADAKGVLKLEEFNSIDSQKMKQIFTKIAQTSGNLAYLPDVEGRDLTVSLLHKKLSGRQKVTGSSLDQGFTLTITQQFFDNDPMTLSR